MPRLGSFQSNLFKPLYAARSIGNISLILRQCEGYDKEYGDFSLRLIQDEKKVCGEMFFERGFEKQFLTSEISDLLMKIKSSRDYKYAGEKFSQTIEDACMALLQEKNITCKLIK